MFRPRHCRDIAMPSGSIPLPHDPPDWEWADDLGFSLRRYFIDRFLARSAATVPPGSRVLDLGGKRGGKGKFHAAAFPIDLVYANLSPRDLPDVVAEGASLPFADACFDAAICAELFEHVRHPHTVLGEVWRTLRPGGRFFVTTPFLFRIHPDPQDYRRFTDQYWRETLSEMGFEAVTTEKQGLFWSTLADMVRALAYQRIIEGRPRRAAIRRLVHRAVAWGKRRAVVWDAGPELADHEFYGAFATGIGVTAVKGGAPPR